MRNVSIFSSQLSFLVDFPDDLFLSSVCLSFSAKNSYNGYIKSSKH